MSVTCTGVSASCRAAASPANPQPMTTTRAPGVAGVAGEPETGSVGGKGPRRGGEVGHLRKNRFLQGGLVGDEGVGRRHSGDGGVESSETVLRHPRRHLATESGGEGVLVDDEQTTGPLDRFTHELVIPRRD